MTYLYHASWSYEFQLYGSNDATCIDEIQHNYLPSILFLLLSLETSSTHSFLSSSFILSLPLSLPLPTSPFLPPSPPSPFLPPSPSSLYQSTQPIHPSLPLLSSLPPFLFLPPFPLFPPSINPPNQYSPLPPFFPILTGSLWRQLSEHTLSLLCNDSVCAPPFHSLGGRKGGGEGKRMGGGIQNMVLVEREGKCLKLYFLSSPRHEYPCLPNVPEIFS